MDQWLQEIKNLPKKIKKLSHVKKLFLTLSLVIVVTGCIWSTILIHTAQYYEKNRETVNDFLIYISRDDYKQAYVLFADRYKNEEAFEIFKKNILPIKAAYVDYKQNSIQITKTTFVLFLLDPFALKYTGKIFYKNGEQTNITALFIWENSQWKLYLFEFN